MKKQPAKLRIFLSIAAIVFLVMVLTVSSLVVYCMILSNQVESRFSGRRWSIPSKVYSDSLWIYPGQRFTIAAISKKLVRLGYRNVSHPPENKGEFQATRRTLTAFLHDLEAPGRARPGFPVRMEFDGSTIATILDSSTNEFIPLLEIEPEEIMLFFGPERERRRLVSIEDVPVHVVHAVLAAEDSRFYSHKGMDVRGIIRAVLVNLKSLALKQGGSTITQQLAKNYFLTAERSFSRKFKELFLSITIEFMYEKHEILEIYLNEIYLGQKGSAAVNGIGEASFFYFDKPVQDLSIVEGAAIAGLIRSPNRYSPYASKDLCLQRRNQVLQTMRKNSWLDDSQLQAAMAAPVEPSGYYAFGKKAPYFLDYLSSQLQTLYTPQALSSMGLTIYTTLDTDVQYAAETALEKGLSRLEKNNPGLVKAGPEKSLEGVVIVMQPHTGYILAMVGGRDYHKSQFNRAVQALRQPGSAFKPFVYAAGLDVYTPASHFSNIPKTYNIDGKSWTPKNYAAFPQEKVRMRTALAHSLNLPTVDLAMNTGLDRIIATSKDFGFSTIEEAYPSLALGAMGVKPLELARAYCAFAADGMLSFPLSLKEVVDENGASLERRNMKINRAISVDKAFLINSMLQSVVEEGTAASLKQMGINFPVSAKTGTTNDSRDAWFVGYTPDIVALVWVGFDDGTPLHSSGARAAMPIWADLMSRMPQYISNSRFSKPKDVVRKVICTRTGLLAVKDRCPETIDEFFLETNVPMGFCPEHQPLNPLEQVIHDFKKFFD